jgi:hypothetical protein
VSSDIPRRVCESKAGFVRIASTAVEQVQAVVVPGDGAGVDGRHRWVFGRRERIGDHQRQRATDSRGRAGVHR